MSVETTSLDNSIFDGGQPNTSSRSKVHNDETSLISYIVPKKGKKQKFFFFMLFSLILFFILNIIILTRQHSRTSDQSAENNISDPKLPLIRSPNYTLITTRKYFQNSIENTFTLENLTVNHFSLNTTATAMNNKSKHVSSLNITVSLRGPRSFNIEIESANRERPRVNGHFTSKPEWTKPRVEDLEYDIYLDLSDVNIKVLRRSSNETLFNVSAADFIYTENLMQFMTTLPSRYLYGLGQQRQKFLFQPGMYFIWGRGDFGKLMLFTIKNHRDKKKPIFLLKKPKFFSL